MAYHALLLSLVLSIYIQSYDTPFVFDLIILKVIYLLAAYCVGNGNYVSFAKYVDTNKLLWYTHRERKGCSVWIVIVRHSSRRRSTRKGSSLHRSCRRCLCFLCWNSTSAWPS